MEAPQDGEHSNVSQIRTFIEGETSTPAQNVTFPTTRVMRVANSDFIDIAKSFPPSIARDPPFRNLVEEEIAGESDLIKISKAISPSGAWDPSLRIPDEEEITTNHETDDLFEPRDMSKSLPPSSAPAAGQEITGEQDGSKRFTGGFGNEVFTGTSSPFGARPFNKSSDPFRKFLRPSAEPVRRQSSFEGPSPSAEVNLFTTEIESEPHRPNKMGESEYIPTGPDQSPPRYHSARDLRPQHRSRFSAGRDPYSCPAHYQTQHDMQREELEELYYPAFFDRPSAEPVRRQSSFEGPSPSAEVNLFTTEIESEPHRPNKMGESEYIPTGPDQSPPRYHSARDLRPQHRSRFSAGRDPYSCPAHYQTQHDMQREELEELYYPAFFDRPMVRRSSYIPRGYPSAPFLQQHQRYRSHRGRPTQSCPAHYEAPDEEWYYGVSRYAKTFTRLRKKDEEIYNAWLKIRDQSLKKLDGLMQHILQLSNENVDPTLDVGAKDKLETMWNNHEIVGDDGGLCDVFVRCNLFEKLIPILLGAPPIYSSSWYSKQDFSKDYIWLQVRNFFRADEYRTLNIRWPILNEDKGENVWTFILRKIEKDLEIIERLVVEREYPPDKDQKNWDADNYPWIYWSIVKHMEVVLCTVSRLVNNSSIEDAHEMLDDYLGLMPLPPSPEENVPLNTPGKNRVALKNRCLIYAEFVDRHRESWETIKKKRLEKEVCFVHFFNDKGPDIENLTWDSHGRKDHRDLSIKEQSLLTWAVHNDHTSLQIVPTVVPINSDIWSIIIHLLVQCPTFPKNDLWVKVLHFAASNGQHLVVRNLLYATRPYDVNLKLNGLTALHGAILMGQLEVVQELLKDPSRIRANEDDDFGRTPMELAKIQNHKDIQKCLLANEEVKESVGKLYRDRQVYRDAANSLLVGAALIATVTFAGWLQPPLGFTQDYNVVQPFPAPPNTFESYMSIQGHKSIYVFAVCNSISFFLSMATVLAGADAALVIEDHIYIKDTVKTMRILLKRITRLFICSMVFGLMAFASAGIAIIPPHQGFQTTMIITICLGSLLCLNFMIEILLFRAMAPSKSPIAKGRHWGTK